MASFRKERPCADVGSDGRGRIAKRSQLRPRAGCVGPASLEPPLDTKSPVDQVHVAERLGHFFAGLDRRSCGERRRNLGFPDRPG